MSDYGKNTIPIDSSVAPANIPEGGGGHGKLGDKLKNKSRDKAAASSKSDQTMSDPSEDSVMGSFKRGGPVKRTGAYKLHAGERVLNRKQAKKYGGRKRSSK